MIGKAWASGSAPFRALIIDSDKDFAAFLQNLLEDAGFEVFSANSAQSGMTLFYQQPPDLTLINIVLTGTDGITLIREIKNQAPQIPTVAMSSSANDCQEENEGFLSLALMQGADAVLHKPFDIEALQDTLQQLLRHHPSIEGLTNHQLGLSS